MKALILSSLLILLGCQSVYAEPVNTQITQENCNAAFKLPSGKWIFDSGRGTTIGAQCNAFIGDCAISFSTMSKDPKPSSYFAGVSKLRSEKAYRTFGHFSSLDTLLAAVNGPFKTDFLNCLKGE